ncbi:VOC family protein [Metapseudomonas boanensis]|uniref:VOC family protein n=1 Tax=Metapseudomonas boanensis TaxID=2822138 RepID=A0ABS5XR28_9GAMM|nr:VOC family protein [Pseudomonas boanensis]MBT8769580.1 VOC family protein [Pseudomonas boanensis]
MVQANNTRTDLFGKSRMGYALVESQKLDDWVRFARDALGMDVREEDDTLVCRLDEHARRLVITRGPLEDMAALGYEIEDQDSLEIVLQRLQHKGVAVAAGDASGAALRGVERYWRCTGPKELPIEFYVTPKLTDAPLSMLASGYVTGSAGMGHVAITSRRPEAMLGFWQEILNARVSDDIEQRMSGLMLDIRFLRLNERHHSVAVACTRGRRMDPIRTRIQHMNIQCATLEDMTAAYQRCRQLGYRIMMGVGQHTNDRELSFYVESPSGFEIEYGWSPIAVDEESWQPMRHQGISTWGHKPLDHNLGDELRQAVRAIRSLMRREYTPF